MPTNLRVCKPIPFIHQIWGETVLFITQTSVRMQYFTIFRDKLHSVNIQDDQSLAGSHFRRSPNLHWTLIELPFNIIKNLLNLFFYLRVLWRCVILKSVWYARHFELTPASDVHERLKTNGTASKIARETTNNQYKKYNTVKHLQRQQFSFTRTSIKVFLKILSLKA